jgi:hypothetical protein
VLPESAIAAGAVGIMAMWLESACTADWSVTIDGRIAMPGRVCIANSPMVNETTKIVRLSHSGATRQRSCPPPNISLLYPYCRTALRREHGTCKRLHPDDRNYSASDTPALDPFCGRANVLHQRLRLRLSLPNVALLPGSRRPT